MKKFLTPQRLKIVIPVALLVVFLLGRFTYKLLFFESTDDSFVKAHVIAISSRVNGMVVKVAVEENQRVHKGDLLVQLDPRDYEVQIKAAQANFSRAHKDLGRFRGYTQDLGPTDRPVFDQYQASALVTEAELTKAQLQLEYTKIVAPEEGRIGRTSVETGEMVSAGQALMALVQPVPWVEANFKESQVAHLRPGQDVRISVDAIPEHEFTGKIESIAPGSGSTFALLPPDNATGNFTKIVQRIAVRIAFDPETTKGYEDRLVSGMSTEVSVRIR